MAPDESRDDRRPLGERPGINENPLGASFRDGPRQSPVSTRSLLRATLPVLVVAVVVLVLSAR